MVESKVPQRRQSRDESGICSKLHCGQRICSACSTISGWIGVAMGAASDVTTLVVVVLVAGLIGSSSVGSMYAMGVKQFEHSNRPGTFRTEQVGQVMSIMVV